MTCRKAVAEKHPIGCRLDRWLWASRFYKTRQAAAAAVRGGHVTLNGARAKPARMVTLDDQLDIRKNQLTYTVIVVGLSATRLGAALAQQLYQETAAGKRVREQQLEQRRLNLLGVHYQRQRPSGRERKLLQQMKRNPQLK